MALLFYVAYSSWLLYRVLSWSTFFRIVVVSSISLLYLHGHVPEIKEEGPIEVEGHFVTEPNWNGSTMTAWIQTSERERYFVKYYAEKEQEKRQFEKVEEYRYKWKVAGEIMPVEKGAHCYTFQTADFLKSNKGSGIIQVHTLNILEERPFYTYIGTHQRMQLKEHIMTVFPPRLQSEALALLIGDRSEMDVETRRAYERLGITHLFAISGLHVGLVTFIIREGLLRLHVRHEVVFILLLLWLPMYAILTGGAPSVWRSVLMTMSLLIALRYRDRFDITDALALSALLYVFYNPHAVFHVGFQLSYLATATIIYSATILSAVQSRFIQGMIITGLTQLVLYPIILYHFYEISISSLITNIFYVPLYTIFILPLQLFFIVGSFLFPQLVEILLRWYEPIRLMIERWTLQLGSFPEQMWVGGKLTAIEIMIAFGSIFYFLIRMEKTWRHRFAWIILMIPIIVIQCRPYFDSEGRVTFLDVGQGDSTIIELPYRQAVYVIDTGGVVRWEDEEWKVKKKPYEVGRSIVVPYLKGRGIHTIDALIITHADADHMEGADEVIEEMRVHSLYYPAGSEMKQQMETLLHQAKERHIPLRTPSASDQWSIGSSQFTYQSPVKGEPYQDNDSSLVLQVTLPHRHIWLMGDLEEEGEYRLLRRLGERRTSPALLKVGHHGSKTSSSEPWIQWLRPDYAIISAGRHNRYNHPHEEVIERLKRYNIQTYETATCRTITYHWKRNKEWFTCYENSN